MFPDEINWPEGEDAPPPDAQELITLLLRQNPLERMGAGKEQKMWHAQVLGEDPVNSLSAASAPLVISSHQGRSGGH